ncbi:hypothetical protein QNH39_25005 [Neobacillus novalis]|uniref:Uncharacterized protein n=1 Tax=Neobacillus novalis TaxID=220687 RepID=A0AA95MW03_9BACI|nr:hypothetical protein [Neobacillus novalis]WHY89140.1 hypothetical protein QNH39_25005 [Neobacillus novalis]
MKDFHCCATCRHFKVEKKGEGMNYYCSRLGYETKPNYKFNCWSPKEQVIQLMNKKNTPQKDN